MAPYYSGIPSALDPVRRWWWVGAVIAGMAVLFYWLISSIPYIQMTPGEQLIFITILIMSPSGDCKCKCQK